MHWSGRQRTLPQDCAVPFGFFWVPVFVQKQNIPLHIYSGTSRIWPVLRSVLLRATGHQNQVQVSALCWGRSVGIARNQGRHKTTSGMCCVSVQVQKCVIKLRKKLGCCFSKYFAKKMTSFCGHRALPDHTAPISRSLSRTLWIMTRADNSVPFIQWLFKYKEIKLVIQ